MFSSRSSGRAATGGGVVEGQAVAGVALQAEGPGHAGGGAQAVQFAGVAVGVGAGVQFHHRGADGGTGLELGGVDEHRDADAGLAQGRDHRRERGALAGDVEAAFGGDLGALFRH